jgi:tetratricopeptide (TPR) repeat protein
VAAHEEARRLDPTIPTSVVNTYMVRGDFERVLRIAEGTAHDDKAMALYRLGRREEALAAWPRAPADAPPTYKAWDEMVVACLSDAPDAREIAERAIGRMTWTDPEGYTTGAILLSRLGSSALALQALHLAVDGGFTVVDPLVHDPWLAPVRGDPRFAEILRRAQARRAEALAVFRSEGGERLLGLCTCD